jgi:hypothetical protein
MENNVNGRGKKSQNMKLNGAVNENHNQAFDAHNKNMYSVNMSQQNEQLILTKANHNSSNKIFTMFNV